QIGLVSATTEFSHPTGSIVITPESDREAAAFLNMAKRLRSALSEGRPEGVVLLAREQVPEDDTELARGCHQRDLRPAPSAHPLIQGPQRARRPDHYPGGLAEGYTSSRGPNWPSVGSAQQNHGSVSRGLPSVEPARIGSARPAGDGDRPAAWSAAARTFANVSGIGSESAALCSTSAARRALRRSP